MFLLVSMFYEIKVLQRLRDFFHALLRNHLMVKRSFLIFRFCRMRPATASENDRKDLYDQRKVVGSLVGEQGNLYKSISQSDEATYLLISNSRCYSLAYARNELSKPHLSPYGYYVAPNGQILRVNYDAHVLTAPSCGDCMDRQNSLTLESSDDGFASTNHATGNHPSNCGSRRIHRHIVKGTSIPASNFISGSSYNSRGDRVEPVLYTTAERHPFDYRTKCYRSAPLNTPFTNSMHGSVTNS